ncbi:C-type lectin domain family 10 member A-like [Liolophura sinensis]|uniref:C-type lectin domain family 10 member A-like n=1 Tax=Liolophura sinensis TaxID=3198878 RepID=UPI003158AB34
MQWVILLVAVVFISSSDGCSRLCPCRREIENITQRIDSLGRVENTLIHQLSMTMRNMTKNMDLLLRDAASNQKMREALTRLTEKVDDMAYEIQDVNTGDENCTDVEIPAGKQSLEVGFKENNTKDLQPEDDEKACPATWVAHAGSCYFFQLSKQRLTQDSANEACNSKYKGSSLVAIESVDEYNFLQQYLSSRYSSIRSRTTNGWLTSGKKVNGQWVWTTTGGPISSGITWAAGQPNGQTCVSLWPSSAFKIADVYCSSYDRQFICEI